MAVSLSIYEHSSALNFLKAQLDAEGSRSGIKSRLSEYVGIQTSYLSQILSEKTHLNLEQGIKTAQFFNLSENETEYFLLLLQADRAGNKELKDFFNKRIKKLKSENEKINSRVQTTAEISDADKSVYYSSWIHGALHVLFSIPEFTNVEQVAQHLHLPFSEVQKSADFLIKIGMLKKVGNQIQTLPAHIHLPEGSPFLQSLHAQWRIKALQSFNQKKPQDLNYTVSYSLSREDAGRIRQNLLSEIERNIKIVAPSKEECAFTCLIDFFEV